MTAAHSYLSYYDYPLLLGPLHYTRTKIEMISGLLTLIKSVFSTFPHQLKSVNNYKLHQYFISTSWHSIREKSSCGEGPPPLLYNSSL